MSPFPLISLEKSQLKVIWAEARGEAVWFGLGGVERCRGLSGLLTWMNCWSNVEAGNSWIVYINMINLALINHRSVIYYCFFYTWLQPWNSGGYLSGVYTSLFCIQQVLGPWCSLNWIMVQWSLTKKLLMTPYGSLWLFLFGKSLLRQEIQLHAAMEAKPNRISVGSSFK